MSTPHCQLPADLEIRIARAVHGLCLACSVLTMLLFLGVTLLVASKPTLLHLVFFGCIAIVCDLLYDRLAREILRGLLSDYL